MRLKQEWLHRPRYALLPLVGSLVGFADGVVFSFLE